MPVTLITGANRGLGYETARRLVGQGHTVYVGARDPERGRRAAGKLGCRAVPIDVTDDESVRAAMQAIDGEEGRLDVLINNAGIWDGQIGADGITGASALAQFDTNAVGIVRATQAALPLLRKSRNPVVVNVSSGLGSFWAVTNPDRPQSRFATVVYSATKAAVSMLTVQYAKALPQIKFNAVEPGYTATDFNKGHDGGQPVEDGAEIIVRMATIGPDGPTGTFQELAGELPW
ncbi:SDR family NAD(P)-dependent oxidoreductase [Acidiferrimicrobium sp. IK]|uniref:SDR family NAD(P)-dependent oxidoreductase n=1 Tax=Acidiferrimicrobium sp. IK TaxID=2871700 RepID=UPI0021CB87A7|nr:SDR family NAD(P)-dependent oxidoreductase [Acidiferrimicrobium sp. IK]MCU4186782.1 SDR family NAD(P)-dependent oxidoreductase [Acidiferrimicrobium sp. IK]